MDRYFDELLELFVDVVVSISFGDVKYLSLRSQTRDGG
jgi:hypothetical protein